MEAGRVQKSLAPPKLVQLERRIEFARMPSVDGSEPPAAEGRACSVVHQSSLYCRRLAARNCGDPGRAAVQRSARQPSAEGGGESLLLDEGHWCADCGSAPRCTVLRCAFADADCVSEADREEWADLGSAGALSSQPHGIYLFRLRLCSMMCTTAVWQDEQGGHRGQGSGCSGFSRHWA
jgi:hypothetical protein